MSASKKSLEREDALRAQLQRRLPKAARTTLSAYAGFVALPPPEADAKAFAAHHAAAKSALSHLEALIKLLQWADTSDAAAQPSKEQPQVDTDRLIAEARARLDTRSLQTTPSATISPLDEETHVNPAPMSSTNVPPGPTED